MPDDIYRVIRAVVEWIADPTVQVVLITGGTRHDRSRQHARRRSGRCWTEIDSFGELFRLCCPGKRLAPPPTCNRGRWGDWHNDFHFLPAWFDRSLPHQLGPPHPGKPNLDARTHSAIWSTVAAPAEGREGSGGHAVA